MLRKILPVACLWVVLQQTAWSDEWAGHSSPAGHWIHLISLNLSSLLTVLWIFVLGICIGSFLNVVIYRMPAGLPLSHPPSRCPSCETELAARDNIPILGWLVLRGRCRYCAIPISARYPLIETAVGGLFVSILLLETFGGLRNLPLREPIRILGGMLETVVHYGYWSLPAYFLLHAFYLTVLLAVCMIGYDGHAVPPRLLRTGVLVALGAAVMWPAAHPVPVAVEVPYSLRQSWTLPLGDLPWIGGSLGPLSISLLGPANVLAGVVSGVVSGWLAGRATGARRPHRTALFAGLVLAGAFCGWQMTWPLLSVVLCGLIVLRVVRLQRIGQVLPLLLFVVGVLFVLRWKQLLNGVMLIRYDGWQWTTTSAAVDWAATIGALILVAVVPGRQGTGNGAQTV